MMDVDTVSNCSINSLQSDDTKSEISTLSGLSNYQDEFANLCHLVNPIKYPINTFNKSSSPKFKYMHMYPLQQELKNYNHIQESYRSDLYNLEKSLELKYYDKIEKLLKTNHRLQSELESANEQITRLLKNYCRSNVPSLDSSLIQLEQKYHILTLKYSELQNDYFQSKTEKEGYEIENKELKTELNELKIDIETKEECVTEFKQKISQQYVEFETLLKNNLKLTQSLNDISSELAHVKKTQDWYKECLHMCQNEKQTLSDEILKCKTDLSLQYENIEILNVELSKWKTKCELTELSVLKDKVRMSKLLETTSLANNFKSDRAKENPTETKDHAQSLVNYYEYTIQDLTHEIVKIKEYVQEQDNISNKLTKENSELLSRCITLQNKIKHSEVVIEELESIKKQLHTEINETKCVLKQKSNELIVRENQILNLQAEIRIQKNEHELIEQTVKTIREQFTVFKAKHKELRNELSAKDKHILQLENEKQKLFMENNWNICELEKLKEKDDVITQLRNQISVNGETLNKYMETIEIMKNEMNKNQEKYMLLLDEKQSTIDKNHLEINKYENALGQYKIMVTNYEKQIIDLQKCVNESKTKIVDLQDNITILKQEINQKDSNINEINKKCIFLQNELKCSQENKNVEVFSCENMSDEKKVDSKNVLLQYFENNKFNCAAVHIKDNQPILAENISNCSNITYNSQKTQNVSFEPTCYATINNISNIVNGSKEEQVQKLNVLLQVKDLELKEKQKKYEANNRTLLRKVKEHMKGRDTAEKHYKYLQEMNNSLSDENNSLKLEIMSKECEVQNIKNLLDKFTKVNEKLKLKLEEQLTKVRTCDKCSSTLEKIDLLEKCIKDLENEKSVNRNLLLDKEEIIVNHEKEIQQLLNAKASIEMLNKKLKEDTNIFLHDKEILSNTIKQLESEIKKNESHVEEFKTLLKQESKQLSESTLENTRLKNSMEEMNAQIKYLSNEVEILSSRLQIKSEELQQLEDKNSKMESSCLEKQKDSQIVINTLKQYVHEIQLEITSINNEKCFLQRFCNDLKVALESHASNNKILQHQLNAVTKEKDFNSLPNLLPNISCDFKCNDDYINQLLQQNKAPLEGKPITEMKSCLDTLKREISTLQEQIAKKNIKY